MLGRQADLFVEFPVHGLLRRLAVLDATFGKLPGMFADALAPEHLVARIDQNDADVRAEAFTVKHDEPSNSFDWSRFFTLGHAMKAHSRGASPKLGLIERLRAGPMR